MNLTAVEVKLGNSLKCIFFEGYNYQEKMLKLGKQEENVLEDWIVFFLFVGLVQAYESVN